MNMRGVKRALLMSLGLGLSLGLWACGTESQEAVRVPLKLRVLPMAALKTPTNQGYRIKLERAELMISDLGFYVAGEAHASLLERASRLILPPAYAHPGHFQGGERLGELPGRHRLVFLPQNPEQPPVGEAILLTGDYHSAAFQYERASASDGLSDTDPLLKHTVLLSGSAQKDGGPEIPFVVQLRADKAQQLQGVVFQASIRPGSQSVLGLAWSLEVPDSASAQGTRSFFDNLDFAALAAEPDGVVHILPSHPKRANAEAYDRLRNRLGDHSYFALKAEGP